MGRRELDEDATIYNDATEEPHTAEPFDETVFATDAPPSAPPPDHITPPDVRRAAESSDPAGAATFDGVDRTQHAIQAMELGVMFRHRFQTVSFGISPRWRVRLTTPDTMSTEGGAKARQSLVLHKEGSPNTGTFTFGFLDATQNVASLKTYAVMQRAYEIRFRRPFEMVESEYERLVDEVRKFVSILAFEVRMVNTEAAAVPPGVPVVRSKGEPRQITLRTIAIGLLAILSVGIAIGYLLAR